MPIEQDGDLTSGELSIIESLIASSDQKPVRELSTKSLARLACGFGTIEEQEVGFIALTESQNLRERFLAMRTTAKRLSREPLQREASTSPDDQAVAACISERLSTSVGAYSRLWEAVSSPIVELQNAAAVALTAARDSLKARLDRPSFAVSRSAEPKPHSDRESIVLTPDVTATLRMSHSGDRLTATAKLLGDWKELSGRAMYLTVDDPCGGIVPIGASSILGADWRLEASVGPDFDVGRLLFGLSLSEATSVDSGVILATVEGSSEAVPISVTSTPRFQQGFLLVDLAIQAPARVLYGAQTLSLAIALGNLSQIIGYWPVSDWSDEPRTIEAPVPGAPDGELQCLSVLRANIR